MRTDMMAFITMKLLILTCLVAVALARPKLPLRYPELLQNPSESSEEIIKEGKFLRLVLPISLESREEYINGMNRQRKVLREKQSDEIKNHVMAESEEQFRRMNEYNQLQLQAAHAQEQIRRMSENSHVQVPFQQLSQLAAYPYAVWYYPQIVQYVPFPPFSDISNPTAPEN
ncbi:PREDICTED: alpha-S1-casein [Cercocebus atys]|uniref:alpha-S1-casein n=1 Tax=Cercocebus atys TaxID=9531 RepID=UPI0005F49CA2|nr:PREDICTED: alpha-S1-casein [Cercocebus atys]